MFSLLEGLVEQSSTLTQHPADQTTSINKLIPVANINQIREAVLPMSNPPQPTRAAQKVVQIETKNYTLKFKTMHSPETD